MKKYIFNFKSIPTHKDSFMCGIKYGQKIIVETTLERAMDKAKEEFLPNHQFRFEYSYLTYVEEE